MRDNLGSGSGVMLERYCRVPDSFLDMDMAGLNRAELVVYLYICRRTIGFDKRFEAISLQQFMTGIITREGRRLDFGTGLCRKTVLAALTNLERLGLIFRHARYKENGAQVASVYELNVEGISSYKAEKNFIKEEFNEGTNEEYGEDLLPFDYLDDEREERSFSDEKEWSRSVFPKAGEGGEEGEPGPVIENTPGGGEKSLPTINRGFKNKVNQNTLLHKGGAQKRGVFGQECDEVERILLENGVWSGLAVQVARQAIINKRGKAYLEGWLDWLAVQPNISNRGAYLVKVIQANCEPPDPNWGKGVPAFTGTSSYQDKHRQRTQKLADSLRRMGLKIPVD